MKQVFTDKGMPAASTPTVAATTSTPPRQAARSPRINTPRSAAPSISSASSTSLPIRPRPESERAFGTLQDRLVKELALAGIATVEAADRFIADTYLPDHARFATPPELEDSAFVPLEYPGQIDDILCRAQTARSPATTPCATKGASSRSPPPQPDTTTSRPGSGSTSIQTEPSPSSTGPDASPATPPTASPSKPQPGRPRETLRRDRPAPCGQVDSRSAPDHFPTGQTATTEADI